MIIIGVTGLHLIRVIVGTVTILIINVVIILIVLLVFYETN